ncbi:DUF4164 domain-containing protein [uncultured Enterovirga sp.]|uniref:DUF4164 domain-containing protein n=1 Tax=uncultured Enterovirga sp. TaxID=2026352 RepID=UPI0035CB9EDA
MGPELADAMGRWQAALGQLEAAVGRYMDSEVRRSDIETELGVMQDDRARLATELESATARLIRVEAVTTHVGQRVGTAIGTLREVLARAEGGAGPSSGPDARG